MTSTTTHHPSSGETGEHFLQIRPEVVRRLRGGNAALVFSLIEFRCRLSGADRIEDEAGRWWRASLSTVAGGTGLTVDQVRKTLAALQKSDEIEATKHRYRGVSDQMMSYRITDLPAIRSIDRMDMGDRPNGSSDRVVDRPNLPLL